jgi:transposase
MRPLLWQPPIELSPAEATIVRRVRRAKLFVFLRQERHRLFDAVFQEELAAMYAPAPQGHPPVPPARLALATLLQAYTGASDAEAVEACVMDRRWQLVLDCLECTDAPFGTGTLVAFRERLIAAELDRRLIERTVDVAARTKGFGHQQLRLALDSSPLWGAGRVEDTLNLLGHALRKAVGMIARHQGREVAQVTAAAGAPVLGTPTSLKAALDVDWDEPASRAWALGVVLEALTAVEQYVAAQPASRVQQAAMAAVGVATQVAAQDVLPDQEGCPRLRDSVARDRRISVEDGQMRHGRKTASQRVDGYKRHVGRDLDSGLVRAVGVTAANAPEASVTPALAADLARQPVRLAELHIDRAYLSSQLVRERADDLTIYCKAWAVRNGAYFAKTAFTLDWAAGRLHCPAGAALPFALGTTVHFPAMLCGSCQLRARCTPSTHGRSVHIHPDEPLLAELRQRQQTAAGRAALRARVGAEHALARIGQWQGDRARYLGQRKNLFDLRRMAVVSNLHDLMRLPDVEQAA